MAESCLPAFCQDEGGDGLERGWGRWAPSDRLIRFLAIDDVNQGLFMEGRSSGVDQFQLTKN